MSWFLFKRKTPQTPPPIQPSTTGASQNDQSATASPRRPPFRPAGSALAQGPPSPSRNKPPSRAASRPPTPPRNGKGTPPLSPSRLAAPGERSPSSPSPKVENIPPQPPSDEKTLEEEKVGPSLTPLPGPTRAPDPMKEMEAAPEIRPPHGEDIDGSKLQPPEMTKQSSEPTKQTSEIIPEPTKRSSETILPEPTKQSSEATLPEPTKQSLEILPEPTKQSSEILPQPIKHSSEILPEPTKQSFETILPEPTKQSSEIPLEPTKQFSKILPEPSKPSTETPFLEPSSSSQISDPLLMGNAKKEEPQPTTIKPPEPVDEQEAAKQKQPASYSNEQQTIKTVVAETSKDKDDHRDRHRELLAQSRAAGIKATPTMAVAINVIITLTGDNRGAFMQLGHPSHEKPIHIHRAYKPSQRVVDQPTEKEDREAAANASYVNSNVQGINNSILVDSHVREMDPGVSVGIPRFPAEEHAKQNDQTTHPPPAELETRDGKRRIRRRCLRGLLMEPSSDSDSDNNNPEKPRRRHHGCRVACNDVL